MVHRCLDKERLGARVLLKIGVEEFQDIPRRPCIRLLYFGTRVIAKPIRWLKAQERRGKIDVAQRVHHKLVDVGVARFVSKLNEVSMPLRFS